VPEAFMKAGIEEVEKIFFSQVFFVDTHTTVWHTTLGKRLK
jgi:hypothetical protein